MYPPYWVSSKEGTFHYDILTGIYSEKGLATIGASHATAKREIKLDTGLRGIKGTQLILHPGAEKFWKEKGKL